MPPIRIGRRGRRCSASISRIIIMRRNIFKANLLHRTILIPSRVDRHLTVDFESEVEGYRLIDSPQAFCNRPPRASAMSWHYLARPPAGTKS